MVALPDIIASNTQIARTLPKRLVTVFAGATSGIGEATLKRLVQYAVEPGIYLFARNPASAARVIAECRQINARGEFIFIQVTLNPIKDTEIGPVKR
jgi:NADP-dependent 3-hydroxy acid dehydrogenase YdfG